MKLGNHRPKRRNATLHKLCASLPGFLSAIGQGCRSGHNPISSQPAARVLPSESQAYSLVRGLTHPPNFPSRQRDVHSRSVRTL